MPRPVRAGFTTPYGSAFGAIRAGGARKHLGTDYHAPAWTAIYGVADGGRVAGIGENHDPNMGFGHSITVVYPGGVKTLDAHMVTRTPLSYGSTVNSNTIIGYVGMTGNAVNGSPPGPHDHHQRWHNGVLVNPEDVYRAQPSAGGGGSTPIPKKEDDVALQILAPFSNTRPNGLQDARAIVGPGFGFIFSNEGDFIDICNVAGLNRAVVRQVGMKPQTDAQTLALLVKIVNTYKSASAPDPITAAKITQIVKDNSVSEAEMVKAIASVKDVQVDLGDVSLDLAPLMELLRTMRAPARFFLGLAPFATGALINSAI